MRSILLMSSITLPGAALAHAGDHGETAWFHALTQPDHLAAAGAVIVVALVVRHVTRRS